MAFSPNICTKHRLWRMDPPKIHMSGYMTGGLRKLYRNIRDDCIDRPKYKKGQFTDDKGHFHLSSSCTMASRYRVISVISVSGQSAVLLKAEDMFNDDELVVIKVLHTNYSQVGLQETHCLQQLRSADPDNVSNTLRLLNIFTFDCHFCMVFECLHPHPITHVFKDISREKLIPSIRKVAIRLLTVLGFLQQQNVIHADLKPDNILIKKKNDLGTVKVIDFGNAIHHIHKEVSLYYEDFNIQTPLYRAPEVVFGVPFGSEIDMWSIGCILAELYLGKPLFLGSDDCSIIEKMTSILGYFPKETFQKGKFYHKLEVFTQQSPDSDTTAALMRYLESRDYKFCSLLAGCLQYDPDKRLKPGQAALHPFLSPELPLGYLLGSQKDPVYTTIYVPGYNKKPKIAPNILRSQPSSLDLLRLGTSVKSDEDSMNSKKKILQDRKQHLRREVSDQNPGGFKVKDQVVSDSDVVHSKKHHKNVCQEGDIKDGKKSYTARKRKSLEISTEPLNDRVPFFNSYTEMDKYETSQINGNEGKVLSRNFGRLDSGSLPKNRISKELGKREEIREYKLNNKDKCISIQNKYTEKMKQKRKKYLKPASRYIEKQRQPDKTCSMAKSDVSCICKDDSDWLSGTEEVTNENVDMEEDENCGDFMEVERINNPLRSTKSVNKKETLFNKQKQLTVENVRNFKRSRKIKRLSEGKSNGSHELKISKNVSHIERQHELIDRHSNYMTVNEKPRHGTYLQNHETYVNSPCQIERIHDKKENESRKKDNLNEKVKRKLKFQGVARPKKYSSKIVKSRNNQFKCKNSRKRLVAAPKEKQVQKNYGHDRKKVQCTFDLGTPDKTIITEQCSNREIQAIKTSLNETFTLNLNSNFHENTLVSRTHSDKTEIVGEKQIAKMQTNLPVFHIKKEIMSSSGESNCTTKRCNRGVPKDNHVGFGKKRLTMESPTNESDNLSNESPSLHTTSRFHRQFTQRTFSRKTPSKISSGFDFICTTVPNSTSILKPSMESPRYARMPQRQHSATKTSYQNSRVASPLYRKQDGVTSPKYRKQERVISPATRRTIMSPSYDHVRLILSDDEMDFDDLKTGAPENSDEEVMLLTI